jgi:RNA polymerase sigma factor (sigma-70 family)
VDGAQDELYRKSEPTLRALALHWLRRWSAAQRVRTTELIDDAFVKLIRSPPKEEWLLRGHFRQFACRNIQSVLIDLLRKQDARRGLEPAAPAGALEGAAAPARGLSSASLLTLREALDRLETQQGPLGRDVIELKYFGEYTFAEIARQKGMAVGTVYEAYKKALGFLAQELRASFPELSGPQDEPEEAPRS